MLQALDGFLFDLTNPFLGQVVSVADFLKAHGRVTVETESELDYFGFLVSEGFQNAVDFFFQRACITTSSGRAFTVSSTKSLRTELSFSRYTGVSSDTCSRLIFTRSVTCSSDIFSERAIFLHFFGLSEIAGNAFPYFFNLYQLICPVQGKADHPALFADCLEDRLANPPNRITDEVETFVDVEALDGVQQTDISFADQIDQGESLILILLGYIDHEAEVRLHQFILGKLFAVTGTGCKVHFLFTSEKGMRLISLRYIVRIFSSEVLLPELMRFCCT
jgi:hypothetical protein